MTPTSGASSCGTVSTTPSRKVLEACGGVLEDQRGGKLRYWVPTT